MRPSARNIAALTAGVAVVLIALMAVRDRADARPVVGAGAPLEAMLALGARPSSAPAARFGPHRLRAVGSRTVSLTAEPAFEQEETAAEALQSEEGAERGEAEALAVGPATLFLFSLARDASESLAFARGFDRQSPRDLTLWRVDALSGRSAPVAKGASDPDGGVHFDRLLVPTSGARLVVTASGSSPDEPGASLPLDLEASRPGPPPTRVQSIAAGRWRLRAYTVAGATLLVDGGGEGPPAQFPPAASGGALLPAARGVEAEIAAPSAGVLLVAQQLADGSVTAWRPVPPPLEMIDTQSAVDSLAENPSP